MPISTSFSSTRSFCQLLLKSVAWVGGMGLLSCATLNAATITKANNTTAITSTGSWVGGVLPTSADIMLFDSTITSALTTSGGGSYSTAGAFQFTSIGGNVIIGMNNGGTTTLNLNATYEIDMSAATADVTFGASGSTAFLRWASGANGGINVASGRTLTLNSNFSNAGNTKTIVLTGGGNIIFNGGANGGGGAMGFSVQGGTNVTMAGTGGWSGASSKEVISGTLNLASDTALGSATLALGGTNVNANTPTLTASGAARTIANNVTLLASALGGNPTIAGSNALTVNGVLTNSGANRTLSVNNSALTTFGTGGIALSEASSNRVLTINGTGNVTVSGVIANGSTSTASGLTYSGSGTLSLTNANTFAGTLTASSGTVRIDNTLAAQNATVSVGATNAVNFGTGITTATFGGLSGAGSLALVNTDTNAVALTVGNNNAATTYSGVLSGSGSLTKIGSGTTTLSSTTSTYGGGTLINAGTIALSGAGSNAGALGSGTVTFQGGTLKLQSNGGGSTSAGTFANAIQVDAGQTGTLVSFGRGELNSTLTGAGTLNLQVDYIRGNMGGNWSGFTGQINVTPNTNGGDFRINNTNGFGTAKINLGTGTSMSMIVNFASTLTNTIGELTGTGVLIGGPTAGRTMTWDVGGANTNAQFDGTIQNSSGPTAITKSGTGTWTLTGANAYTGTTTVSDGTLFANNATGSATGGGAVTVANGAMLAGDGAIATDAGKNFTLNGQLAVGTSGATQGTDFSLTTGLGGSTILGAGSFVDLDLWSTTGTDQSGNLTAADMIRLFGDLNITSGATLKIGNPNALTFQAGDVFKLFDWTGLTLRTGADWTLNSADLNLGGLTLDTSSLYTLGTVSILAAPEPSRALLLMLGVIGLVARRRRVR